MPKYNTELPLVLLLEYKNNIAEKIKFLSETTKFGHLFDMPFGKFHQEMAKIKVHGPSLCTVGESINQLGCCRKTKIVQHGLNNVSDPNVSTETPN